LEEIAGSNDEAASKASGLKSQLEKGEVLLALLILDELLAPTESLSRSIQSSTATVSGIIESTKVIISHFNSLKSNENFRKHWKNMMTKIEKYGLDEPKLPRNRQPPKRFSLPNNPQFSSAAEYLKDIYCKAIDLIVQEIQFRFDQPGIKQFKQIEDLIVQWKTLKDEDSETLLTKVCTFYELDKSALRIQLNMLHSQHDPSYTFNTGLELVKLFKNWKPETQNLFFELGKLLKIFLVVPISSATAERSFSVLRRIKSYLRSTMNQSRLNSLCILNCYPELVDKLDVKTLITDFINNDFRLFTFGQTQDNE
jgi:hypothetical protein